MKKTMTTAFGKEVFLLGCDADESYLWLEAPSWDCGWYWGIGYVETYTNNKNPHLAKDISSHTHFDSKFAKLDDWMQLDSPFTEDEKYLIYELMTELYTLKKTASILYVGGAHITSKNKALRQFEADNTKEYERINKIVIPAIWEELRAILTD